MYVTNAKKPPKLAAPAKEAAPSKRLATIGIDAICSHISSGESLLSWAKQNGFAIVTVHDWINADPTRAEKYARAREERADAVFESLDDVSERAVAAETAVEVAGLRLKADIIKWKLARMSPRKYGDKLAIGGDPDAPAIKHDVSLSPDEAYLRMLGK